AARHSGLHGVRVRAVGERVLGGVGRGAGHLCRAVAPLAVGADLALLDDGHGYLRSLKSRRTATIVLRASGTLNALASVGPAASSSASAAVRNASSVAGPPRSRASAVAARQGLWATPPSAIRTSATSPPATSSTAAAETSANA